MCGEEKILPLMKLDRNYASVLVLTLYCFSQRYIQKRSTPSGFVKVPDNRLATILENYLVKSETKCLKIVDVRIFRNLGIY